MRVHSMTHIFALSYSSVPCPTVLPKNHIAKASCFKAVRKGRALYTEMGRAEVDHFRVLVKHNLQTVRSVTDGTAPTA